MRLGSLYLFEAVAFVNIRDPSVLVILVFQAVYGAGDVQQAIPGHGGEASNKRLAIFAALIRAPD